MAAGVEDDARAEQAKAKTLRKIADGQEAGRLEHLGGVSTRAQVDTLESLLRQAKYRGMRKRGENTGNADSSATAEDAAHAEYPHPDIHKDHIKDIARAVLEMPRRSAPASPRRRRPSGRRRNGSAIGSGG